MSTSTLFTGVSTVAIPVTDQERSKDLFEQLGFELRFDADLGGGFRWIELAPPGAVTSVALVATGDGLPTGIDTGIRLVAPEAG
jgi:catechol 2,3-dioxygenase-like lactoylglutathione lyase family enzyme